jgi:hypothetical protein
MMGCVNLFFNVIYGFISLGGLAIWHNLGSTPNSVCWNDSLTPQCGAPFANHKLLPPAFSANLHVKYVCVNAAAISDDDTPDFPSFPAHTSHAASNIASGFEHVEVPSIRTWLTR